MKSIILPLGLALLASAATLTSAEAAKGPKFNVAPLVSDQQGVAPNTDPNLVNPWGIAYAPGGPAWVSDQGTSKTTIYNKTTGGSGGAAINVPSLFPSGQVFNKGSGFKITANGHTAQSLFLFATLTGTIAGWNSSVDPSNTVVAVDDSDEGAVYTGMAIDPTASHIYVADFHNNEVAIYDSNFNETGSFTDTTLPKGFAPFNVAVLNGQLYVTFAKRAKTGRSKAGKGLGYVDVFDLNGNLLSHLISKGDLNAPWGLTIAPKGFNGLDGALLVGNFGDGEIHAYDPSSGEDLATLRGGNGKTLEIDGLWTIDAGPNANLVFTAGPDNETHGLFGQIQPTK